MSGVCVCATCVNRNLPSWCSCQKLLAPDWRTVAVHLLLQHRQEPEPNVTQQSQLSCVKKHLGEHHSGWIIRMCICVLCVILCCVANYLLYTYLRFVARLSVSSSVSYLGKCVRMSVRFSGGSLSFSCLACSSSCFLITVNTERNRVRPKIWVVSYRGRLSQNWGTLQ